jgi:hypothetical protein
MAQGKNVGAKNFRPYNTIRCGTVRLLFLAAGCLLGCLERVNLEFFTLDFHFDVSGEITNSTQPLASRRRVRGADLTNGTYGDPLTALTIVVDHLA